jgi:hypothetical protein
MIQRYSYLILKPPQNAYVLGVFIYGNIRFALAIHQKGQLCVSIIRENVLVWCITRVELLVYNFSKGF